MSTRNFNNAAQKFVSYVYDIFASKTKIRELRENRYNISNRREYEANMLQENNEMNRLYDLTFEFKQVCQDFLGIDPHELRELDSNYGRVIGPGVTPIKSHD